MFTQGIVSDRFVGSVFSLPLNETGNWFFLKPSVSGQGAAMRTSAAFLQSKTVTTCAGLQPTRTEFQECLAGLQTVSIRGGYYNGAEKTVLKCVSCSGTWRVNVRDLRAQVCARGGGSSGRQPVQARCSR